MVGCGWVVFEDGLVWSRVWLGVRVGWVEVGLGRAAFGWVLRLGLELVALEVGVGVEVGRARVGWGWVWCFQ